MTMTPDGIQFKVKCKQRRLFVSWEKVFGAAAMTGDNEDVMIAACKVAFEEIKYEADKNVAGQD